MESQLQKLRGLFSFSRASDNHREPQQLLSLLDALSGQPPFQVIEALFANYLPAVAEQRNLHMRFKLLENCRAEARRCLPVFEKAVTDAVLPLPIEAANSALAADNFLKTLANSYISIAAGISQQNQDAGLAHLLQQASRRAMQALYRRQMLAYRAYATPSATSWQQLHDLYRNARARGLASAGGERSIERIYLCALLTAFADPHKIPRRDLTTLRYVIESLAPFAGIVDATEVTRDRATNAARFLVAPDEGSAGRPLNKAGSEAPVVGSFVVECRAIVNAIDRKLGEEADNGNKVPESLLMTLRESLGGQQTRRFSRARFKPKADLVPGIDRAIPFLAGAARRPLENGKHELPPGGSEWSLINESPSGFAIRYLKGEKWPMQAGDLVVLRTREEGRIHICLVRRIANLDFSKLELGLQELGGDAEIVRLPAADDNPPVVALLLPRMPGFDGLAGLLAKPGSLSVSDLIVATHHDGKVSRWRQGGQAESNGAVEFHLLEAVE